VLHLLNGDATRTVFERTGLPGEVAVWRDILVEGPVSADDTPVPALLARQGFLAERLGIDPDAYARSAHAQAAALEAAARHDEVVLWFEQDLFCAVNLWRVLDWLARHVPGPRLSLVYPGAEDGRGLGALAADVLVALFSARTALTAEALALGQRAWAAYVSTDPLAVAALAERDETALSFVRAAARCHLGRFPSVTSGLNEVESATLAVLGGGPRAFRTLFREVSADPRVRPHGLGDVQLAAVVRGLMPLVGAVGAGAADLQQAELLLTERGHAVLAGEVDWLSLHPLDTWVGGVRLIHGRPMWRWDEASGRLVVL
jgi:hypothetical protein